MKIRPKSLIRCVAAAVTALVLLSFALPASAALRVVTSTPDLAALTKHIGGEQVSVTALALHTQDPHWVDARPHLALALSKADLLIITGLELEIGWLPTLITGARNADILPGGRGHLDASELVSKLEVATSKVDRSQGDVHPHGNPHYLLDPRRAAKVARGIAVRLAALEPASAGSFRARADDFESKLTKWIKHWEEQLSALRGKKVIAYHKSFPYFADWLGLTIADHVEPRPGIPPNPRHVAHVIEVARESGARILIQEAWHPDSTSRLIAEKSGAKLVQIPGAPNFNAGQSYIGWLNEIVKTLSAASKS